MSEIPEKILNKIKARSRAQAEVYYLHSKRARIFYEKDELKTLHEDIKEGVGIRVIDSGRIGFASSNVLEDRVLDQSIDEALTIAHKSKANPGNVLPLPQTYSEVKGLYSKAFESYNLPHLLEKARFFFEMAKGFDPRIKVDSASLELRINRTEVANTNGLRGSKEKTILSFVIMGMAVDGDDISSFDYKFGLTNNEDNLDALLEHTAKEFAKTIVESLGAKTVTSFKGLALLSPQVVHSLIVEPLTQLVSGENILEKRSPFKDKLGEKIAVNGLTIYDAPLTNDSPYADPFDREGVATRYVSIIKDGVLKGFIHNSYTATLLGTEPTGNAAGSFSNLPGIGFHNVHIEGFHDLEEIVNNIDKGIYINRFSGNANSVNGLFSGTVKGGWYYEKGRKVHSITDTMMTGNVFELLKSIVAISRETQQTPVGELPYILVDGISFTGK
ncbi:TldD/PmbA family protein [Kosmotoga pacifica]|uniref:Peptidase U62 n=1 Tax=Kosmotoga pacifica TaxID=1330330 RepID=A0A0G2Z7E2_9BACT|nr:TldD/PmbA family protein [Kosmotoga pacifica]AKI97462.1 hypothetical protein IX53_06105 [Kosmotoga pacifica]